jgi:hypothetical protein
MSYSEMFLLFSVTCVAVLYFRAIYLKNPVVQMPIVKYGLPLLTFLLITPILIG